MSLAALAACAAGAAGFTVTEDFSVADPADGNRHLVAAADAAWRYVATRLYSPRTHLLYECQTGGTNGVVGLQPTLEEIARNYPNGAGWHTGMDDGPQLNGPMLLAALGRWERTHEASVAEFAHDLFRGLRLCAEVSKVPGFLARSVSPRDGRSHYVQSSRDQYTYFVYALWRYWQSSLATPEERDAVRRMLVDVARYAERVVTPENRYSFLREDGGPALYQEMWTDDLKPTRNEKTGIDVFGGLCAHEAMRLPMIYAAAWAVSGDAHWRELEVRYVDVGLHMTQGLLPKGLHGFALVQMQLSHRLLWEVEPDAARKSRIAATFARVPTLAANLHESVSRNFRDLGGDFSARIGDWRKYPMETPVDGPADGVIGGIRYLTPQWPERFAKVVWCLREAGEVVSAMKLCPDGTVPAAYRETLERCFASIDCGNHFTSGPVHLLMAYWLPEM